MTHPTPLEQAHVQSLDAIDATDSIDSIESVDSLLPGSESGCLYCPPPQLGSVSRGEKCLEYLLLQGDLLASPGHTPQLGGVPINKIKIHSSGE